MRTEQTELLGRDHELETLLGIVERAGSGGAAFAVIEGEPGIGKTHLLDEAAAHGHRVGFRVLRGAAVEIGQEPFGPIVEALEITADDADGMRGDLARLLYGESPVRPRDLSFRITELVLELLAEMAAERPVVLILDDLQWADPSSLAVAARVMHRFADSPVALIAARRPHPTVAAVESFVERVDRAGGTVLQLGPVANDAVEALAARVIGAPPGPLLRRQLSKAGGNPLFVRELTHALLEAGVVEVRNGTAEVELSDVPASLRPAILRRLRTLGTDHLDLLRLASVLGSSFSLGDLEAVYGRNAVEIFEMLEPPIDAGFLVDAPAGLAFRHDVVREALYYEMPEALRAHLHVAVARALAEARASPTKVAAHLALGASPGDDWAIAWLRRAARATAPRAPAVAVGLLERALEIAGPDHRDRVALLAEQALPLVWAGRFDDAISKGEEGLALHRTSDQEAVLRLALLRAYLSRDLTEEALPHAEITESKRFPPGVAGQMLAETAFVRILRGELEAGRRAAERGIMLGKQHDDPMAVVTGQTALAFALLAEQRVGEALETISAAVDLVMENEELRQHTTESILGVALTDADRFDDAGRVLREGLRWAERVGAAWLLPNYVGGLGVHAFWLGEWDPALSHFRRWMGIVRSSGDVGGPVRICGAAAVIGVHRNDLSLAADAVSLGERMLARGPRHSSAFWVIWGKALLSEASGQPEDAYRLLLREWRHLDARKLRWHHRLAGPDLVRLAIEFGEREAAVSVPEAVAETARIAAAPSAEAAALHCRGLLENDPRLLAHAAERYRDAGRILPVAVALEASSAASGEGVRPNAAAERLKESLEIYDRLGATRDVRRVTAALRAMGVRAAGRGPKGRPASGWEALTDAELEIASLVAEGLSNRQIAERLFVSRRTVEAHLRAIFRKLGVASRAEVATAAVRRLG